MKEKPSGEESPLPTRRYYVSSSCRFSSKDNKTTKTKNWALFTRGRCLVSWSLGGLVGCPPGWEDGRAGTGTGLTYLPMGSLSIANAFTFHLTLSYQERVAEVLREKGKGFSKRESSLKKKLGYFREIRINYNNRRSTYVGSIFFKFAAESTILSTIFFSLTRVIFLLYSDLI